MTPERLAQLRAELTRVSGTGLGLPYARRLVSLLGGRLDLVGEPGRGSTFTVVRPVAGA